MCHSLGEKTIDDWLTLNGIEHEREPMYPGTKMRGDFLVNDAIIEYFGLAGDDDYDKRIEKKRKLAAEGSLILVEIFPKDLAQWHKAQHRVAAELGVRLKSSATV